MSRTPSRPDGWRPSGRRTWALALAWNERRTSPRRTSSASLPCILLSSPCDLRKGFPHGLPRPWNAARAPLPSRSRTERSGLTSDGPCACAHPRPCLRRCPSLQREVVALSSEARPARCEREGGCGAIGPRCGLPSAGPRSLLRRTAPRRRRRGCVRRRRTPRTRQRRAAGRRLRRFTRAQTHRRRVSAASSAVRTSPPCFDQHQVAFEILRSTHCFYLFFSRPIVLGCQ